MWRAQAQTAYGCCLQVVSACLGLLRGCHDRSRLPAAQLLLLLSRQPALVPRLEPCLNTLLALLAESGERQRYLSVAIVPPCILRKQVAVLVPRLERCLETVLTLLVAVR
jgi:hypothetical protein